MYLVCTLGLMCLLQPCSRFFRAHFTVLTCRQYPDLLKDLRTPHFVDDKLQSLPLLARPPLRWVFIGPPGAFTPNHVDPCLVSAWLVQIQGRKRFTFTAPEDVPLLLNQDGRLLHPHTREAALERNARFFEIVVEPGDLLYIPEGWAHEVTCLDVCITLTGDWIPQERFAAVELAWMWHLKETGSLPLPNTPAVELSGLLDPTIILQAGEVLPRIWTPSRKERKEFEDGPILMTGDGAAFAYSCSHAVEAMEKRQAVEAETLLHANLRQLHLMKISVPSIHGQPVDSWGLTQFSVIATPEPLNWLPTLWQVLLSLTLTDLRVPGNDLGDETIVALCSMPTHLRVLDLAHNRLSEVALHAISGSVDLRALDCLCIGGNDFSRSTSNDWEALLLHRCVN